MRKYALCLLLVGLLLSGLVSSVVFADSVTLKDGTVLKGTVVRTEKDVLLLKTTWAKECVTVKLDQVSALDVPEASVRVGRRMVSGRIEGNTFTSDGGNVTAPLDSLAPLKLNVSPWATTANISLSATSLDKSVIDFCGKASTVYTSPADDWNANLSWDGTYKDTDGTHKRTTHWDGQYSREWKNNTFGFFSGDLQQNTEVDYNWRSELVVGAGVHALDNEKQTLDLQAGVMYSNASRDGGLNQNGFDGKLSADYYLYLPSDVVSHDTPAASGFLGSDVNRQYRNFAEVTWPMNGSCDLSLSHTLVYNRDSTIGMKATDNTFCLGVKFSK